MKAAIVETPDQLVVRDVPRPAPGEYDALCQLLYGATCSGTDWHIIRGRFPFPVQYPTVLGHESIGRVVEVGPKVRNLEAGDLVTRVGTPPVGQINVNWGGFAEFGIARDHWAMKEDGCPIEQWNAHRVNQVLPADFDPAGSTMIITWRETLSYLLRMGVGPGARVLVLGSGGTGLSLVTHAKNLGAAFVAVAGSASRADAGRAAGADAYVDYREDIAAALADEVGEGFDFIIDAVGKAGQIDRVLGTIRSGGTVGIYGIDDFNGCAINPRVGRDFLVMNRHYDEEESHEQVVAFVQAGKLDARVYLDVDQPYTLDRIGEAFEAVRERKHIKAVIKLT